MMEEAELEKDAKDIIGYIHLSQELLSSDKSFPSIFIAEGITTYIKGFPVASIFYSSLSVEVCLLILVNKRLSGVNDKNRRRLRQFGGLINKAYQLGILDEKHRQLAHKRAAYGPVVIGDAV